MMGFMSKRGGTGYAGIRGLKGTVSYFNTCRLLLLLLLLLQTNLILY